MTIELPSKAKDGYTLFAEGKLVANDFIKGLNLTILSFDSNYIVTLFYTYPHHRRAYVIYQDKTRLLSKTRLPNVLSPVNILYKASGRKIDNLKHCLYLLKKNSKAYVSYPTIFYQKLCATVELNKNISKIDISNLMQSFNLGGLNC